MIYRWDAEYPIPLPLQLKVWELHGQELTNIELLDYRDPREGEAEISKQHLSDYIYQNVGDSVSLYLTEMKVRVDEDGVVPAIANISPFQSP